LDEFESIIVCISVELERATVPLWNMKSLKFINVSPNSFHEQKSLYKSYCDMMIIPIGLPQWSVCLKQFVYMVGV